LLAQLGHSWSVRAPSARRAGAAWIHVLVRQPSAGADSVADSDSHLLYLGMASQVRQSSVVGRFFRSNSRSAGPYRASGASCRVFTTARCHRQFAPEVTVRVLAEPDAGAN